MPISNRNSKLIAKNTLLLYVRMFIVTIISLYTSRVVLKTLGVEDFGLYNVVGGVVAMFTILTGSLSAAISRYLTYEIGKGDEDKLKRIFSTSINIQFILIAIVVLLMETAGLWFLNNKMVIPDSRMVAANWVFQLSVIAFAINLWSVPYNAIVIAHEKMGFVAFIGIFQSVSTLLVALIIAYNPFDRLIYYAVLIGLVQIFIRLIYGFYCKRHFKESVYQFFFDKILFKEMLGFAGWNFIGAAAGVCRTQGVNIILNLFYGATVNAARGLAVQVNTAVSGFATNFMTAMNPQIIKSYASGDYEYMNKLLFKGTKLSFYLLLFISMPILAETTMLLSIWLSEVPQYALEFVQLILIFALCEVISLPMVTVMLATGDIKKYQIIVGTTNLMNLPISYFLLKYIGFSNYPQITMIVAIILSLVCLLERIILMRDMVKLDVRGYILNVILPILLVSLLSSIYPFFINRTSPEHSILMSILNIFLTVSICGVVIYFVGMKDDERDFLKEQILQRFKNNKHEE